jgi:endo-1,4-beta-xylanase
MLFWLAGSALLAADDSPALKEVFKNDFMIGAALNERQFSEKDAKATALIE